jgi:hypothetical protein
MKTYKVIISSYEDHDTFGPFATKELAEEVKVKLIEWSVRHDLHMKLFAEYDEAPDDYEAINSSPYHSHCFGTGGGFILNNKDVKVVEANEIFYSIEQFEKVMDKSYIFEEDEQ